jgi:hypothetical protein
MSTMNAMKICRYDEVVGLADELRSQGRFVVEIDGEHIRTYEDYIDAMVDGFDFPDKLREEMKGYNYAAFLDWIRDLDWVNNYSDSNVDFALFIYDYEAFMHDTSGAKARVIETFVQYMLYFWHSEIERTVVDGRRCPFDIYLVSGKG